jgi:hypothetical protein
MTDFILDDEAMDDDEFQIVVDPGDGNTIKRILKRKKTPDERSFADKYRETADSLNQDTQKAVIDAVEDLKRWKAIAEGQTDSEDDSCITPSQPAPCQPVYQIQPWLAAAGAVATTGLAAHQ